MCDKEKNIYDLELHETLKLNINSVFTLVMRVPGGWNYVYDVSVVFVPFDNEFMSRIKDTTNHIEEELTKVWCKDCDLANICTLKLKQYTNAVTCPEYRDNLPF